MDEKKKRHLRVRTNSLGFSYDLNVEISTIEPDHIINGSSSGSLFDSSAAEAKTGI